MGLGHNLRGNRGGPRKTKPATDLTRWRLSCSEGRQTWQYFERDEDITREQTFLEKYYVGLDTSSEAPPFPKAEKAQEAAENGIKFYSKLQMEDGHWAGDNSGSLFFVPGFVIACYVTRTPFTEAQRLEMIRYTRSVQCQDGGWGLHVEGAPNVFGTTLNYTALRLLGIPPSDPDLIKSRNLLHKLGGASVIATWGKLWLAVLNVYKWEAVHSFLPELWLLPSWLPFHPSNTWSYTRHTYLPMSYIHGMRITAPEDDLIRQLRKELFVEDFDEIHWPSLMNRVDSTDVYSPHSWITDLMMSKGEQCESVLRWYEKHPIGFLRKKALRVVYDHIVAEDKYTHFVNMGAVMKPLQLIARYHGDGPLSKDFKQSVVQMQDYLWMDVDGLKVTGNTGSQFWDAAFVAQAFLEAGVDKMKGMKDCMTALHGFMRISQLPGNPPECKKHHMQMGEGGFPFSTKFMNWYVSDCTAEGIKAVIELQEKYNFAAPIPDEKIFRGIDTLLDMQNDEGGWGSMEKTKGRKYLEMFNISDLFSEIMLDYPYVECTSSCMKGLTTFTLAYPQYRCSEINTALRKALRFIEHKQRPDGSWEGIWAVCFTYGTWFGLDAYSCMGYKYGKDGQAHEAVKKACDFLVSKQMEDGGWGEDFKSCERREYTHNETSQTVNTCWALLGLLAVDYPNLDVLERGIKVIMSKQLPNGDWPQECVNGAFCRTCSIIYANYKNVFPIWTLGRFVHLHPESKLVHS